MATFPDDPWTGLRKPGVLGPKTVSTTAPVPGALPGGGLTLDALMARQKELAGKTVPMTEMTSPMQGLAYALQEGLQGFKEGRATRDVADAQGAFSGALSSYLGGDQSQANRDVIGRYDPATMVSLWKAEQDKANQEHWRPATTDELSKYPGLDTSKGYEVSDKTGDLRAIGGGGITINPPSAETAAKIGLTQGFTDNFDAVIKSIDAGEMTGLNWPLAVALGRGNGGVMYRNIRQGTDGLVRMLTGAGMNASEAADKVSQYEPAITDDAQTLHSKVTQLKQAIDNVTRGIETRGRDAVKDPNLLTGDGTPAPAPAPAPAPDATSGTPAPAPDQPAEPGGGSYESGKVYEFDDPHNKGKKIRARFKGGDSSNASNWEPVS